MSGNGVSVVRKVLSAGAAARACQVAPRTVSKWIDAGRLKGYRVPESRDRRVMAEDLVAFMRQYGMDERIVADAERRYCQPDTPTLTVGLSAGQRVECEEHAPAGVVHADSLFDAGLMLRERAVRLVVVDLGVGRASAEAIATAVGARVDLGFVRVVAVTDDPTAGDADAAALVAAGFDSVHSTPCDWSEIFRGGKRSG